MSDETKHSPEPWAWRDSNELRTLADRGDYRYGSLVIHARDDDDNNEAVGEANRRRIVACVNACAGIPTEALEAGALRDAIWLLEVAVVGGVKTLQGDDQGKAILRALGRLS